MRQSLVFNLSKLKYPVLFDVPVLSQLVGLRGIFARASHIWPPTLPIQAHFLSFDPPIFCGQPSPKPFGAAHYFATRFPDEPFIFLYPITMSLERPIYALSFAAQYRRFRKAHPRARLIVMANTKGEEQLLRGLGVVVHLAPQNMFVDESMCYPIPGRERRYDAIYNATLAPMKRHELARLLPSCAYVTKLFDHWPSRLKREQRNEFVRALPRGHAIINDINEDGFAPMDHVQVNEAMASAHVGLCLSKLEGAMYASIEYLLAGLPVVSTRSKGGRDVFFHPETTLIVDDNPRAVQEGVAAMKARALPPEYVRATTLRLMTAERERFNIFIDQLRGHQIARPDDRWSFSYYPKLRKVASLSNFEDQFTSSRRAAAIHKPNAT
ncbi:MAG: glycosyltransferase family 1 protein [Burkholderiales bacterium]|jgi:glycosyltransferase involved in cell wall biosynthesis|uniref:glycosyltransferase n=2 Tax=Pseudomonadota TaxID=1224 RepID=UPI000C36F226|nr:glycosyltransferase [Methylobacterium sp.]MBP32612.1 hypothetical protein [Methylobacterium sp.]RTL15150.1 MAG: glycosyltransferase family 1 protein [Burkholderiales bacterium]